MHEVLEKIGKVGIVPVIVIDRAEDAVPLAGALLDGGIPIAEVTLRTPAAGEAIRRIAAEVPDVLVGAGTVLTVDAVEKAAAAGAKFIVTPGFNPRVVDACAERGLPITPGTSTPTDMDMALERGLEAVKFFPAGASGGIAALKAIAAPYKALRFIPTGGIDASTLGAYLSFDRVLAVGGSWMVKPEMVRAGDFAGIARLARESVAIALGFDLAHVGINCATDAESMSAAGQLARLFAMPLRPGNSSNFAGEGFEVLKAPGRGARGHIAVRTRSIDRAIAHLERLGAEVDRESAVRKDGRIVAVYLKSEMAGFALHLLQAK
jgi:2-dehydro-3-deoxyphosphogluconate aldolase / (4S)-4-hydroxy-2-oxoglutarate aldolase